MKGVQVNACAAPRAEASYTSSRLHKGGILCRGTLLAPYLHVKHRQRGPG